MYRLCEPDAKIVVLLTKPIRQFTEPCLSLIGICWRRSSGRCCPYRLRLLGHRFMVASHLLAPSPNHLANLVRSLVIGRTANPFATGVGIAAGRPDPTPFPLNGTTFGTGRALR